ncbi:MAG TPA: YetF domain-containing protein [Beutenbergiaceae bacterium]|nr:YetF domain-containing protein [Beutenbergiaceae bacterium]
MEIIIRAVIVFFFLWAITRLVGRSTLGELSAFELILFLTMGDLVQNALIGEDYSLTAVMLAVGTFAVLTIALSWLHSRRTGPHQVIHGAPVVVVRDGEPDIAVMRRERLAFDDFMAAARQEGLETLGAIRLAVLESNGQISFFAGEKQR